MDVYWLATAVSDIPFLHKREAVGYEIAFLCSTFCCFNGGEVSLRASANEGRLRIEIETEANIRTRLEKLYGEQGSVTV
jgi:hypothetical protein